MIAATNVNLEQGIADGTIRQDLYYRLNKIPIQIPPLRQRKEDIETLALHLITKINQDYGRSVEGLSEDALKLLVHYDWPGNVRELENILGRAVIYMHYSEVIITAKHLPTLNDVSEHTEPTSVDFTIQSGETLSMLVEQYEKDVILHVLKEHDYNKTKTAKRLNISIRALYYKLEKYGIANIGMQ